MQANADALSAALGVPLPPLDGPRSKDKHIAAAQKLERLADFLGVLVQHVPGAAANLPAGDPPVVTDPPDHDEVARAEAEGMVEHDDAGNTPADEADDSGPPDEADDEDEPDSVDETQVGTAQPNPGGSAAGKSRHP